MKTLLSPEVYKRHTGMEVLETPFPDRIVLATRSGSKPCVWAMPILENTRWVVSNSPRLLSYMFKDDGLFGYTGRYQDLINSSFETLEDAISAFHLFYKN